MTGYILGIVGVIVLSAAVNLIIPSGKIAAFVRSIISLFLFFVIVSPIVSFAKKENIADDLGNVFEQTVDVSTSQVEAVRNSVKTIVKTNYKLDADVEIDWEKENGVANILSVQVFLVDLETELNIDDTERLKREVKMICGDDVEVEIHG